MVLESNKRFKLYVTCVSSLSLFLGPSINLVHHFLAQGFFQASFVFSAPLQPSPSILLLLPLSLPFTTLSLFIFSFFVLVPWRSQWNLQRSQVGPNLQSVLKCNLKRKKRPSLCLLVRFCPLKSSLVEQLRRLLIQLGPLLKMWR